ncbi:MAG: SDR family oxidoreductase [Pseudonocardiaceae bacterium]
MRVAVIGGTGFVGRHTIRALRHTGHDAVVVARSTGTDVTTGAGLDAALAGVEAVIDVTNTAAQDAAAAREFFGTSTGHLLAAEQRAGVAHHVVLSIVGVDRIEGNAHFAGKRRQEELALAGPIPATILRATQFHEFAAMVVDWTRQDAVATVPPLLVQPVAASDVGQVLAEVATGAPQDRTLELAGPETQDLVDMARRTLTARGESVRLIPSWRGGLFSVEVAGEVLLPGPDAQLAPTTFDAWLAAEATSTSSGSTAQRASP